MVTPPARLAATLLVLCAVGAGCSNQPTGGAARFQSPADLVSFNGITRKNDGLHDYLAVASSRGDDLVFVDPADDRPVLSPAAVFPLAIATAPRPVRLAAASLGDKAAGGADLLVAVSSGSLDLQIVETWSTTNRVAQSVALAPALGGEGEILAIAGLTPPSASAASPRARLLVSASGGRLVVVDFTRDPATGGVIAGAPVVKSIGFDPTAIAIERGGTRAFFSSLDALAGSATAPVFGVAWLDAGADPASPWPVSVIDAKAPTRALAVASVAERLVDPTNPNASSTFGPAARFRIYAVLDSSGCGPDRAIECGVATLDENGLVPDPLGELPYRAPLRVPGIASSLAIALPPANGTGRIVDAGLNPSVPLLLVQPAGRNTSAVAAVTSTDGLVYLFDLGRYAPVTAGSALVGGTGISFAFTTQPPDVALQGSANFQKTVVLGLWNDFPAGTAATPVAVVATPTELAAHVQTTVGYTPTDTWLVTWQGELPGLSSRRGVVGRTAAGETYVAFQSNAGTAAQPRWIAGATPGDPALGLHAGDLALVTPDDAAVCARADAATPVELRVDAAPLLAPDPVLFPGGAVKLAPGSCFDASLAPGQTASASITLRAAGLVLTAERAGYLGRPVVDQPFTLAYVPEAALSGEALAVDRKLRRSFYPAEAPCSTAAGNVCVPCAADPAQSCFAGFPWSPDPLAPGPTLAFRVGLLQTDPAGAPVTSPVGAATLSLVPRDARVVIRTATGLVPIGYRPLQGGVLPVGILSYDPTIFPNRVNDPVRFYAAYRDDQVLELSPSVVGGNLRPLR